MRKLTAPKSTPTPKPLQENIAGVYSYTEPKKELIPISFVEAPTSATRKIYSIRLGQKNETLIFCNHTDLTAVTEMVLCYSWEGKTEYCFDYNEYSYTFILHSRHAQKTVTICRC